MMAVLDVKTKTSESKHSMTLDEYLIEILPPTYFEEPYFRFWTLIVIESMNLLGQDTDDDLERLNKLLISYYSAEEISDALIKNILREIVSIRGAGFWRDFSTIGLKYKCLNAIAVANQYKDTDTYYGQDCVVTAFQFINFHDNMGDYLIKYIQQKLSKYELASSE